MLDTEKRDPRAPGNTRMYLYFDYSELGAALVREGQPQGSADRDQ